MKKVILFLVFCVLAGCTQQSSAERGSWLGWEYQAGELYRHVDEEKGVVCYQSIRVLYSKTSYQLSCVKF